MSYWRKIFEFWRPNRKLFFFWLATLALVAFFGVWFVWGFRPARGAVENISIPAGTGRWAVASELARQKIITSPVHFVIFIILTNKSVKAGDYRLDPNLALPTIAKILDQGENRYVTLRVLEGWRREQIAELIAQRGLDGAGFLALSGDFEGQLFPDTYFIAPDAAPSQILDKLLANYRIRTQDFGVTREQMILASIVEREAKTDAERPIIAGIFTNRLKIAMKLEADPTVQYGRDTNRLKRGEAITSYWGPITLADYTAVESSFNTYLNAGLPPGAICNPGLASIKAAINPAVTDAYYFFHAPDEVLITSRTLAEHNANKAKHFRKS